MRAPQSGCRIWSEPCGPPECRGARHGRLRGDAEGEGAGGAWLRSRGGGGEGRCESGGIARKTGGAEGGEQSACG
eukprot:scaffold629_cov84-Isochrysis_galbana.AAC.2